MDCTNRVIHNLFPVSWTVWQPFYMDICIVGLEDIFWKYTAKGMQRWLDTGIQQVQQEWMIPSTTGETALCLNSAEPQIIPSICLSCWRSHIIRLNYEQHHVHGCKHLKSGFWGSSCQIQPCNRVAVLTIKVEHESPWIICNICIWTSESMYSRVYRVQSSLADHKLNAAYLDQAEEVPVAPALSQWPSSLDSSRNDCLCCVTSQALLTLLSRLEQVPLPDELASEIRDSSRRDGLFCFSGTWERDGKTQGGRLAIRADNLWSSGQT